MDGLMMMVIDNDDGVWWLNLDVMVNGDDYYEIVWYMNF